MAALDFPNSPTVGQQYTAPNGAIYTWDGTAWTVSGVISTGTAAGGDLSGTYPNPTVIPAAKSKWTDGGTILTPTAAAYANKVTINNLGNLGVAASITFNSANVSGGGQGLLAAYSTNGIYLAANDRWTPPTPSIASWNFEMISAGATTLVHRAPGAASGTQDQSFLFNSNGNFVITGSYAEKSTGTTWANPSDARLKKNVAPYTRGLAAIVALQPKTFEFNGLGGSQDGMPGIGLIADDVQPVMPEMVSVTSTKLSADDEAPIDLLMLDTSALQLALVNAVKELTARVTGLEAIITAAGLAVPTPSNA